MNIKKGQSVDNSVLINLVVSTSQQAYPSQSQGSIGSPCS